MKKLIAVSLAAAFALSATPALATWPMPFPSNDITVRNYNRASVTNEVVTTADTGANQAIGGAAVNTGKGTNVANGGSAGEIETGDASAVSVVANTVNSNRTVVSSDCGCRGDVSVKNYNRSRVSNSVGTTALTGGNTAVGGVASNTSTGWWWGAGSNTANGGSAGEIDTGDADAYANIVNTVGSNVTRVVR